jgi:aryl-alcohol dehydrogenase-like predicted oxidoreductase
MNKRILGRTGVHVSEVAFGGVEIGMPYGIGVKGVDDMLTEGEAIRLLQKALDEGINFFDTARLYGNSEAIMGKAFADRRDRVVLSTKCRHFRDKEGNMAAEPELRRFIEQSLKESLAALQTDYVDVFMLHQADMEILGNETIAAVFSDLRSKGIVRAIGASTYEVSETQQVIDAGIWDVVQLPFNLMDQRHKELFELAARKGVGIVVRSVLLKGLLSDRGEGLHPALQNVKQHIRNYDQLLREGIPRLSDLAVKFALSFDEVSTVLVGIDRMEYLSRSLAAANGEYLDGLTLRKAAELAFPEPAFLNLPHWEKMGWLT